MNFLPILSTAVLGAVLTAQVHVFTVVPAAASCGPQMAVHALAQTGSNHDDLALVGTGLHANALGAMNWGVYPTYAKLPGGCLLLADVVWSDYFVTNEFGDFKREIVWPLWDVGHFYMQMGSIDLFANGGYEVRTTDCMLVKCQIQ